MSEEEEEVWRPTRHISGYDSRGPLISHPAPYVHHSVGGNPRARRERSSIKVLFGTGNLTSFGRRIIEACPPAGIGERDLIERLNGLSAYADFQRNITELIEAGYLLQKDGRYTRAK